MTYKSDDFPEPGATCERPDFLADPPLESDDPAAPAQTPAPADASETTAP